MAFILLFSNTMKLKLYRVYMGMAFNYIILSVVFYFRYKNRASQINSREGENYYGMG